MNDLCKRAITEFIRVVDNEVNNLNEVELYSRIFNNEGKYEIWVGTEIYGAYWAFRAMTRDCDDFVECYMRMEEYFDAKCKSVVRALQESE